MKTIGLLGGMSWESSIEYERTIHQEVRRRLGGSHSALTIHWTFDFADIQALQEAGDWAGALAELRRAAHALTAAGAELLVICTNTMHRIADELAEMIEVPLIHIADATAAAVHRDGLNRVGLLGTSYTMEMDFYRGRLSREYGLEVLIPPAPDRAEIHRIIYEELVRGVVSPGSRDFVLEVIGGLVGEGAEGVIAGCTEIELLVQPGHLSIPYYPTARLHALAAVDAALAED